ncbi:MAG: sulfatase [Lentisphaeraceae bacterium]|nr:sulfatase [Lentisphaeraceae bacterium]
MPQIFALLLSLSTLLSAQERPNFLWIISEDNSKHHIKHFDPNGVSMPHLEALAKDGVTFDAACSNGAVCSVARSSLISGCYAPRVGAQFHRRQKFVPMPEGLKPFPYYLKQAGYFTTNKTKADYNFKVDMKEIWNGTTDWSKRSPGQSFFHKRTLKSSHESTGHFKMSLVNQGKLDDAMKKIIVPPHHPDTKVFRYSYAAYQEKMKGIDRQLGGIIKRLKNDGLYENTIIFYFGDHGGILPRSKGYAYETGLAAPLVIRVPKKWQHLIPFKPGTRTNALVNFIDFGPSLINAAGLKVSEKFDGKAFLGKDISAVQMQQRIALGYADRFDEKYDLVRSLRRGNFKYIRNFQPFNCDALHNFYRYRQLAYLELRQLHKQGKLNTEQSQFFAKKSAEALYDLSKDPYELNNLAKDPAHAAKVKELRTSLNSYLKEKMDLSLFPESHLAQQAFDNPTAYGIKHKQQIADLLDTANLQLQPYADIEGKLKLALQSEDQWQRYWGCIVASSFYQKAAVLKTQICKIANEDKNLLVRVRAAEYLAHLGDASAVKIIADAAYQSKDAIELNLILNSAAMLYELDSKKFVFELNKGQLQAKSKLIAERLKYLQKR